MHFFDTSKDTNISANWVLGARIEFFENMHWVLADFLSFRFFFLNFVKLCISQWSLFGNEIDSFYAARICVKKFNLRKHRQIEFWWFFDWVLWKITEFRKKLSSWAIEFFYKCTKNKPEMTTSPHKPRLKIPLIWSKG